MLFVTHRFGIGIALATVGLLGGCAPNRPPAQVSTDQSFAAYQNAEIESERQEFIDARSKQLGQVDDAIGSLEAKLAYQAAYATAPERAEWSQRLWELRQKRVKLSAEVARARKASTLEWREMRGGLAVAIDTLQADANKIGVDIGRLFSSPEKQQSRLCSLDVPAAKATVATAFDRVELTVITSDMPALSALRRGAETLSGIREYSSVQTDGDETSTIKVPVRVSYETIAGGVQVRFTPQEPGQLSTLLAVIERDAVAVGTGRCVSPTPPGA